MTEDFLWFDRATRTRILVPGGPEGIGFEFDSHSVPRLVRWILDALDLSIDAAAVHDLLYQYLGRLPKALCNPWRGFDRADCDRIYNEINIARGIPGRTAWVAYRGVRLGGWVVWRRRERALRPPRSPRRNTRASASS